MIKLGTSRWVGIGERLGDVRNDPRIFAGIPVEAIYETRHTREGTRWRLKKVGVRVWNGLIWLRIATSGVLL
jgi:hypothetical protein